ncbi:hypothetical protein GCM10007301_44320 [Azorhizobium oxalatiphilum]|uniref:Uncharacterized protein n=1 Tax=Azorhizobium oxalatiphilum TaxID=980631 RepID=A0A917FH18_9HYPH|nr:hypothetical protein [Azorhizobium oxalatiphilum]GGF79422.1 hypothetical protein GCM10007301_44320 [Azorhizobium oxalatiphilum]
MADYYPLLVRAISGLPQNNAEARKVVFDRARAALLKQLRSVDPPLPEGEIGRERMALEEAIRRIEMEQADASPATAAPTPPPPRPPRPEAAPHAPLNPRREGDTPADASGGRPAFSRAAPRPAEPVEPESEPEVEEDDQTIEVTTLDERRPRIGRAKVRVRGSAAPEERGGKGRVIVFLILALIVIGAIGGVVWKRDMVAALFASKQPQQTATQQAPATPAPDQPKSADRLTQAGGDAGARPTQPQTSPRAPGAAVTTRAFLFEESPGNAQQVQQFEGTVTWKTETVAGGPGLPPDIGIRADISIPERKINVSFTLRRNLDQTLPASHTLEINFGLPPDFPYGGVNNVPVVRVKQTESAQGAPLAGLSVKISPTAFLIGLSAAQVDKARNLQLLQTRPWIDIPVVYTNNKRAILAFEKGPAGTQAFQDAFSAWGELYQGDANGG